MIKKTTLQLLLILLFPIIGFSQPTQFVILDGTNNEYIKIPDSDSINKTTLNNRTVEFWFRVDNASIVTKQMLYKERAIVRGVNIWIENDSLKLGMFSTNKDWYGTWFRHKIESNTWYHVALVLDNVGTSGLKFYLNGASVSSGKGGKLFTNEGDVYVGGSKSNNKSLFPKINTTWTNDKFEAIDDTKTEALTITYFDFKGAIGYFRIWNSARTQTEIDDNKDIKLTILNDSTERMVAYLDGNRVKYVTNTGSSAYTNPGGIRVQSNCCS
ncbi:MAG: hypothetical protein DSZ14_05710 [Candidatus Thioglobus sp.]|nr:MAG: hypothetical protein DSZ14_05710 [Candidatus Thioglobus sp.]